MTEKSEKTEKTVKTEKTIRSKLEILPVNKTHAFYSPIEGNDVLVRTGTMGEGSSFLHACLHAYYKDYSFMDKRKRNKLVSKLRSNLSKELDRQRWLDLSNNVIVKLPFQEIVKKLLSDFYSHILKDKPAKYCTKIVADLIKTENDRETYKVACELEPLETLESNLLQVSYNTTSDDKLDKVVQTIVSNFTKRFTVLFRPLDPARRNYCLDKTKQLIERILNLAQDLSFKKYLKKSVDTSVVVDNYSINVISEKLGRDIYFFDSKTRMPYLIGNKENIKGRKAILIMWVGGVHYEVVGRLLEGEKSKIQREFAVDDFLIKRINAFLFRPEVVMDIYPNLIPYLPKEVREVKMKEESASASTSRSESSQEESESKSSGSSKEENEGTSRSKSNRSSESTSRSSKEEESESESSHSKSNRKERRKPSAKPSRKRD